MFYSLPTETKLDIFKCLNYEELCSIKQTNLFLRDFVNNFEGELAREKLINISIEYFNQTKGLLHKLVKPKAGNFDFPLNEQLEERLKNGLKNPIPLYLPDQDLNNKNIVIGLSKVCADYTQHIKLQLPTIIKNKKDLKIVYYYLNKLFNCSFKYGFIDDFVFNPEFIELLFGRISIQFYIQRSNLYVMDNTIEYLFNFILNHLIGGTLILHFLIDRADLKKYINILFKILIRGDNFEEVYLMFTSRAGILNNTNITMLYDYIAEYIAASRDCLKLVHDITLDYSSPTSFKLSERAEKVETKQMNDLKSAIYQFANIYDPKVRFSFCHEEWNDGSNFNVKIKIKKVEFE